MNKKTLYTLAVAALIAVGAYFVITNSNTPAPVKTDSQAKTGQIDKIKVAASNETIENEMLLNIASEKGIASKYNLEIEKNMASSDVTTILTSGNADFSMQNLTNTLSAFLGGSADSDKDLKWLGTITDYPSYLTFVTKYQKADYSKIAKIAVKRVGGNDHISMVGLLPVLGISSSQVNYVTADDDKAKVALFEKGEIDATFISSDEARAQLKSKGGYYFTEPKDTLKTVGIPKGLLTTSKTLKTRADITKRFVEMMYDTKNYMLSHKSETTELIKKDFKQNDDLAKQNYDRTSLALSKSFVPNPADLQRVLPIVVKVAKIDSKRNIIDFAFTDYAKEVASK